VGTETEEKEKKKKRKGIKKEEMRKDEDGNKETYHSQMTAGRHAIC
jgi:hypothetical protein